MNQESWMTENMGQFEDCGPQEYICDKCDETGEIANDAGEFCECPKCLGLGVIYDS